MRRQSNTMTMIPPMLVPPIISKYSHGFNGGCLFVYRGYEMFENIWSEEPSNAASIDREETNFLLPRGSPRLL